MVTLMAAFNGEGCVGRCDANCYNAEHEECDCICGGANHGVGLVAAVRQTEELGQKMLDAYRKANPEVVVTEMHVPEVVQLSFFERDSPWREWDAREQQLVRVSHEDIPF